MALDCRRNEQQLIHEETGDPRYADRRNFYEAEKWSGDGQRVEEMTLATQHIFERVYSEATKIGLTSASGHEADKEYAITPATHGQRCRHAVYNVWSWGHLRELECAGFGPAWAPCVFWQARRLVNAID